MARSKQKYRAGTTVKTSISLSETVNGWAEVLASKRGYDNFSAYIADLIRRDKERDDAESARMLAKPKDPDTDTSLFRLNEKSKPSKQ